MALRWKSPAELVADAKATAATAAHAVAHGAAAAAHAVASGVVTAATAVADVATGAVHRIERIIPMAGSTDALEDALNAGLDFAVTLRKAIDPASAGGKTVTLDELLASVSDGKVKKSIADLVASIDALIKGGHPDIIDLVTKASAALLDVLGTLKDALASGGITADKLLHTVSDEGLKESIVKVLGELDEIPDELHSLDMWKIIGLVQKFSGRLPELLGTK